MDLLQSIIYGLVQGLGEFLPISSSAHLVLVPWLFKWNDPGLTFDIALHLGTLISVIAYFWKDWLNLIAKGFSDYKSRDGKLFWYLVAASIPGAIGGFLLEKKAETVFRNPLLIAIMLIVMGAVLCLADRKSLKKTGLENITFKTSLLIGISQILAIIPGVSRSGITMTTGLLLGMTRDGAARFSFLLSTPIIFGAALVKVPVVITNPSVIDTGFLTGMLVSCIVGFASIGILLRYIQTRNFMPFVWYRFILGAIVIGVVVLR
jgi:undecaprenyl-diphosphatase